MSGERQGEWQEWPFEPLAVLRALAKHQVQYVLTGDLAAVLQGSPLPAYEIEIAPAPGADNGARLEAALADLDAIALTDVDDARQALAENVDLSFYTPYGHLDVHNKPTGFKNHAELRRNTLRMPLEQGLTVLVSPVRDIIRSRTAAGNERQIPALEAVLEQTRAGARN